MNSLNIHSPLTPEPNRSPDSVKIKTYDSEGRVKYLNAYESDPFAFNSGFGRFNAIANWMVKNVWQPKAVQAEIEGKTYYLKAGDLKHIWDENFLQNHQNITNALQTHHVEHTIHKIKSLIKEIREIDSESIPFKSEGVLDKEIKAFTNKLSYYQLGDLLVGDLLEDKRFDQPELKAQLIAVILRLGQVIARKDLDKMKAFDSQFIKIGTKTVEILVLENPTETDFGFGKDKKGGLYILTNSDVISLTPSEASLVKYVPKKERRNSEENLSLSFFESKEKSISCSPSSSQDMELSLSEDEESLYQDIEMEPSKNEGEMTESVVIQEKPSPNVTIIFNEKEDSVVNSQKGSVIINDNSAKGSVVINEEKAYPFIPKNAHKLLLAERSSFRIHGGSTLFNRPICPNLKAKIIDKNQAEIKEKLALRRLDVKIAFNENIPTKLDTKSESSEITFIIDDSELLAYFCKQSKEADQAIDRLLAATQASKQHLLKLLSKVESKEDKFKMLKTFEEMGKQISTDTLVSVYVNKKFKNHFPFILKREANSDRIEFYISTHFLGEGAFKKVHDALRLRKNTLGKGSVRQLVRLKVKTKGISQSKARKRIADVLQEGQHLDRIHQTADALNQYVVDPYFAGFFVQNGMTEVIEGGAFSPDLLPLSVDKSAKLLVFQTKYEQGDGEKLFGASFKNQLNSLTGGARGLSRLHALKLAHCDFKLANLLENRIADFGTLTEIDGKNPPKGGSPMYMAPEIIKTSPLNGVFFGADPVKPNAIATDKGDSFSLGICIIQLLTGSDNPFRLSQGNKMGEICPGALNQAEMDNVIEQIKNWLNSSEMPANEKTSKLKLLEIGRQLLINEPANRLSCSQAANQMEELQKTAIIAIQSMITPKAVMIVLGVFFNKF